MPECSITIVQGMRGSGKTNYLKQRIGPLSPLFIVDIRNEYTHITAFRTCEEFLYWLAALGKFFQPQSKKIQYRFSFSKLEEYRKLFELMGGFRNCTILWDEADALFSSRYLERPITDVFLGSRNNNCNMLFVSKRPFLIPVMVRSQADEFVIFRTEEERDIDYLSKRLRKAFPKNPFDLKMGEAILFKTDATPTVHQFPKFSGSGLLESSEGKSNRKVIKLKA